MPNRLDLEQARQNVGPDLGPNWLQKLTAYRVPTEVQKHNSMIFP